MPEAIHFLVLWVGSFLTLCLAVASSAVFFRLAEADVTFKSKGKEVAAAAFASFFEATGLLVMIAVLPGATKVLLFPALILYFVYYLTHMSDWNGHEPVVILLFQALIGYCALELFKGEIGTAATALVVFGILMAVFGSVLKNMF